MEKIILLLVFSPLILCVFCLFLCIMIFIRDGLIGEFFLYSLFCLAVIGFYVWLYIKGKKDKKEQEKQDSLEEERIKSLNQQAKEGKWQFPAEKFFKICEQENIQDLDNPFYMEKAKLLAERCIKEAAPELTKDSYECYLTETSLRDAFREGLILVAEAEQKEIERKMQIKDIKPNESERTFITRASQLAPLKGTAKRYKMLNNLWIDYDSRIRDIVEGEKAMRQLGMIYLQQQQKENSWAVMGGLAEGIAGPAAGVVVAANVMANNAQIQRHNAQMRNAAMEIMSGIPSMSSDKNKLSEECKNIQHQMGSCSSKVVLATPSSQEIWSKIKHKKATVVRNDSGVLAISLPIQLTQAFDLGLPDNVNVVIDGTIVGEVWCKKEFVGDVHFPLPMYGLPINMCGEYTLDGMCPRSAEYDMKYTVKLKNEQNLWIMER